MRRQRKRQRQSGLYRRKCSYEVDSVAAATEIFCFTSMLKRYFLLLLPSQLGPELIQL